jgi:hypothetical protein
MDSTIRDLVSEIKWTNEKTLALYMQMLNEIGIPDFLDKKTGGCAVWDNWKEYNEISIYDAALLSDIISVSIPVKLFANYTNVVISEEAMLHLTDIIAKICHPIIIYGCSETTNMRIHADSWENILSKKDLINQISSGCYRSS